MSCYKNHVYAALHSLPKTPIRNVSTKREKQRESACATHAPHNEARRAATTRGKAWRKNSISFSGFSFSLLNRIGPFGTRWESNQTAKSRDESREQSSVYSPTQREAACRARRDGGARSTALKCSVVLGFFFGSFLLLSSPTSRCSPTTF